MATNTMQSQASGDGSKSRTASAKVRAVIRLDVKELCQREGILNPYQLSEMTRLPYATCRRIWQGTPSMIGLQTIERICDVLRVRPGQLFDYEYEPDKPKTKRKARK